jgi:uncharacterized membrane protein YeaQ/YmgE (transglycosylase-associated protein family)
MHMFLHGEDPPRVPASQNPLYSSRRFVLGISVVFTVESARLEYVPTVAGNIWGCHANAAIDAIALGGSIGCVLASLVTRARGRGKDGWGVFATVIIGLMACVVDFLSSVRSVNELHKSKVAALKPWYIGAIMWVIALCVFVLLLFIG